MFVNRQQLFVLARPDKQLIRFILAYENAVLSLLQYGTTALFHYILHYCMIALHLTLQYYCITS